MGGWVGGSFLPVEDVSHRAEEEGGWDDDCDEHELASNAGVSACEKRAWIIRRRAAVE